MERNTIKDRREKKELDREHLLILLFDWVIEIKGIKDSRVQVLYIKYLKYFEGVSELNYRLDTSPWYSLQGLIDFDILKSNDLTFERPIVRVRDILWKLLVF